MRVQLRCCCFTTVLWTTVMNEHKKKILTLNKIINRGHFLKNLFENSNVSVLKWNLHNNSSIMCSYSQLKFLIDQRYTTKLSRIWARFLKYLFEFNINLTEKSITQCKLMHFHFKTEFSLLWKHTKCTFNFGLKSLQNFAHSVALLTKQWWTSPRQFVAWSFHFPSQNNN